MLDTLTLLVASSTTYNLLVRGICAVDLMIHVNLTPLAQAKLVVKRYISSSLCGVSESVMQV